LNAESGTLLPTIPEEFFVAIPLDEIAVQFLLSKPRHRLAKRQLLLSPGEIQK
jgi:hypothetical protein